MSDTPQTKPVHSLGSLPKFVINLEAMEVKEILEDARDRCSELRDAAETARSNLGDALESLEEGDVSRFLDHLRWADEALDSCEGAALDVKEMID